MKKGQLTKEMILGRAAALFNTEGYSRASLSDIMAATGLEKGGIYNHFGSKDQLALEAFEFAVKQAGSRIKEAVDAQPDAVGKLNTIVDYFSGLQKNGQLPGGCPVMNTAIECDDSMPELKLRAKNAMNRLLKFTESIIDEGMNSGELRRDLDAADCAAQLIAALEGGLMMTKLLGVTARTQSIWIFWKEQIKSWKRGKPS